MTILLWGCSKEEFTNLEAEVEKTEEVEKAEETEGTDASEASEEVEEESPESEVTEEETSEGSEEPEENQMLRPIRLNFCRERTILKLLLLLHPSPIMQMVY